MAWEWVTNKARKATELDAEYKSHSSLIDRLSELPPDTSYPEIERTWSTLDDRARAGFKMTLGALILKQQAIRTPAGKARLEKLVGLRNGIDRAAGATTATDAALQTKSRSQLIGATRDRITALVDRAGAIPRGEMITALRRELDASRPQIEAKGAATWNALSARFASSAGKCAHLISWSFERAAYGYTDQQYKRIAMQCELRGDKLAVTYAETGETYMSDTYPSDLSMMLGGSNTRQFTGLLEKESDP